MLYGVKDFEALMRSRHVMTAVRRGQAELRQRCEALVTMIVQLVDALQIPDPCCDHNVDKK